MSDVRAFRTEGLGDSTYLLTFSGLAVLVDPQRDIDRFLDELGSAQLRWVLETHLHNDYVSGGLAAAVRTGAELVLPAGAAPAFRHTPAFHNEELSDGGLSILPLHTPGHTPEHTSYVISIDGRQGAVFSGGSLLVGSAGRSDLLGPERADSLARLQYRSVRRLADLPADTSLYPTHGAGSFCTASETRGHTSTIGQERVHNPVLGHEDEESFVTEHLSELEPYPTYYARMAPINLAGPPPEPESTPPALTDRELPAESTVVDIRPAEEFAGGHVPGSYNIPLSDSFGTWFGWLIPAGAKAYLVADPQTDVDEALTQLHRIGVDDIAGIVESPTSPTSVTSKIGKLDEVPTNGQVLDVRSPAERSMHARPGSHHRYLPGLVEGPPPEIDPTQPVWVLCASGYRAAIGASLLRHHGLDAIPVIDGGIPDLT